MWDNCGTQMNVTSKNLLTLPDGRYKIEPNFYLVVRNDGKSRNYVFRYTYQGKRRDMSLGSPDVKTLSVAKIEAVKCRAMVAEGIDPLQKRTTWRNETLEEPTFQEFAESVIDEIFELKMCKGNGRKIKQVSVLRRLVYPQIGNVKVSQVTTRMIVDTVRPYWNERIATANNMLNIIRDVYQIAIRDGLYQYNNPASYKDGIRAYLPPMSKVLKTRHRKAPTMEVLREALLDFLFGKEKYKDMRYAVVIGALTALRLNEFSYLKWEEIDFKTRTIYIPPERRKDCVNETFTVPLTEQMIFVLKLKGIKESGNVFVSRLSGMELDHTSICRFLKKYTNSTWHCHGMRATFREWAVNNGIEYEVGEKCLMHSVGTAVYRSYQRSDLLELRREAMTRYNDALLPMSLLKK